MLEALVEEGQQSQKLRALRFRSAFSPVAVSYPRGVVAMARRDVRKAALHFSQTERQQPDDAARSLGQ